MKYKELIFGTNLRADVYVKNWPGGMLGLQMKAEVRESLLCDSVSFANNYINTWIDNKFQKSFGRKATHYYTVYNMKYDHLQLFYSSAKTDIHICTIGKK